jgi:hypothetical protein
MLHSTFLERAYLKDILSKYHPNWDIANLTPTQMNEVNKIISDYVVPRIQDEWYKKHNNNLPDKSHKQYKIDNDDYEVDDDYDSDYNHGAYDNFDYENGYTDVDNWWDREEI